MDIIADILYALRSYMESSHSDQGLAYLEIFGVLQSLRVQQDAVRQLNKIITGKQLDLEALYPDTKEVRDISIRVAGHPVSGNGSSHFLIRYTVSKWSFELWKYSQAGGRTAARIDLPALIRKNTIALVAAMDAIIDFITADDKRHKETFMGNSLTALFNNSVYFSSKVFEGVSDRSPMGTVGIECIKEILTKFRAALTERSPHFEKAGFVFHDIPKLEYALKKFEQYMLGNDAQNENDAYILASFIQAELQKLAEIAAEIDADYKIEPVS